MWHRYPALAYGAVFLGVMGHASSEFVSVLTGVGGPEASVWRFTLGGLGLVLFALAVPESRNLLEPLRRAGPRLVALSLLGVTGAYLAFHWSLDFATVPQVATVVTTIPIFVGLANMRINRQPFTMAKLVSGVAAVVGVGLLLTDGVLSQLAGSAQNLVGMALAIVCAALFGAYMVLVRPLIAEFGALRITALTLGIGAVGLWLLVGIAWGIWVDPTAILDRPTGEWTALATLALFNTTVTQFLWIGGLAAVPDITRGSYLFFLKPVIAAFLAAAFLGQVIGPFDAGAIAVICAAVVLELAWTRLAARRLRTG